MEEEQPGGQLNEWRGAGRKNSQPSRPDPTVKSTRPMDGSTCLLPTTQREGVSAWGPHLEGAQSQLQGEADAQASTVRQEVEDDVVNSKQWDEEKG